MVYLFTYGGFDCPLYLEETYKTKREFLDAYEKMDEPTRKGIVHIIEGKEFQVEQDEVEIVKSWKLTSR